MLWLLVALAFADAPEEGLTVVVIAEKSVSEAHRELALELEKLGYQRKGVDAQGREVWSVKGSRPTILLKDGLVTLRDHTVQVRVANGFALDVLSPRQVNRLASQALTDIEAPLAGWRDALAREHVAERLIATGERLRSTWERGVADDGRVLPDTASKRAEILKMWADTSDTDAGRRVRLHIREYVTDHCIGADGFTAAEIDPVDRGQFPDRFGDPVAPVERIAPTPAGKNRCLATDRDCVLPILP